MAELKDGKIVFSQKSLRWDETTTTLKELIAFSDYLKDPSTSPPLTRIPDSHRPLIANLIHESDKAITPLTKHVKKLIMRRCDSSLSDDDKSLLEDPRIPMEVISLAVTEVAERVNYGIEGAPVALSLWRWEVRDLDSMLPTPSEESICNAVVAKQRQHERVDARNSLKTSFEALNDEQREKLLKKSTGKKKGDDANASTSAEAGASKDSPKISKKAGNENKVQQTKESKAKVPTVSKEAKPKNKQAQMMSSFFKASAKVKTPTTKAITVEGQSDFEKTFKPFLVKKDTRVAPVSQFLDERLNVRKMPRGNKGKEKAKNKNFLVLDEDGDVEMEIIEIGSAPVSPVKGVVEVEEEMMDILGLTTRELLDQFINGVPLPRLVSRRRQVIQPQGSGPILKSTWSPSRSIRSIVTQLTEAEITGDTKGARKLQRLLKDRKQIPAKLLQFHDNSRPGYYGTWTKSSHQVGPRTPFSKDLVAFDYSYDSGQEWEDEPEDAEEVSAGLDDDSDSVAGEDEDDGEFDDFLVPDDETDEPIPSSPVIHGRSLSPFSSSGSGGVGTAGVPMLGVKRKAGNQKESKKKKAFKPLIPYTAGPFWENKIGDCVDVFKGFRIQLLNDTPFPIDPFTWVSEEVDVSEVAEGVVSNGVAAMIVGSGPTSSKTSYSNDGFVIPALPPHLHPSTQINLPASHNSPLSSKLVSSPPGTSQHPSVTNILQPKPKPAAKPFPSTYLSELLHLIHNSTDTKVVLVDKIATHFRTKEEDEVKRKLKKKREVVKSAVEGAVKDYAVKDGKVWKIKDEAWGCAGIPSSAESPIGLTSSATVAVGMDIVP